MRVSRLAVFLGFLMLGCGAKVQFTPLNPSPKEMASRTLESVEVFSSKSPDREFVEVGIISARQESGWSSEEVVLPALRKEAAKRGCDALILGGSDDEVVGSATSAGSSVLTLKGMKATCIVFE